MLLNRIALSRVVYIVHITSAVRSFTFAVSRSRVEAESTRTRAGETTRCVMTGHVVAMSGTRVAEHALVEVCAQHHLQSSYSKSTVTAAKEAMTRG